MSRFKNIRPKNKPYCKLDWNPDSSVPNVPDNWRLPLAIYAVYLWSKGDGSDIVQFKEKRAIGAYKRVREDNQKAFVAFNAPSPLELVMMAKQTMMSNVKEDALEVLDHNNISDEALGLLIASYKRWINAGRHCA